MSIQYKETTLDNGLRVVSDTMKTVESVSVGVYVNAGSRFENVQNNGVAHYLEHMAFKGTARRSAEDIAREIEDVGGNMNAYTSRESTAYHMKLLKEDVGLGVDMLADILQNSTFIEQEMERERGVIIQEIGQYADQPDEVCFDNLQEEVFQNHAAGRNILGTVDTVGHMKADDLRAFMDTYYTADNMVLSAAGDVEHEALVDLAQKHFGHLKNSPIPASEKLAYTQGKRIEKREIEQAHVAMAWEGISVLDDMFYDANIYTAAMGNGMASRLFQEVREKRGLCYSVFAFMHNYMDAGFFGVYAGTAAKDVDELMAVCTQELEKGTRTLTHEEVERAKTQMKAGIRMALESTDARMGRMPRDLFVYGKHMDLANVMAKIDAVSVESAQAAGVRLTNPNTQSLSLVGPVGNRG